MTQTRTRQIAERIETIKKYINEKAQFRHNIVTGKLEYKSLQMPAYKEVDDYTLNTMSVELAERNIKCGPSELKDILMSRLSPRFNPITTYIVNLHPGTVKRITLRKLASTVPDIKPTALVKSL
jgi:hypothetical protein